MSEDPNLPPARHEHSDAQPRVMAILGAVMLGLVVFGVGVAHFLVPSNRAPAAHAAPASGYQAGVNEELGIVRDWQAEAASTRAHLEGYAWADRPAGRVRVPIEVAIDVLLARAEPPRPTP